MWQEFQWPPTKERLTVKCTVGPLLHSAGPVKPLSTGEVDNVVYKQRSIGNRSMAATGSCGLLLLNVLEITAKAQFRVRVSSVSDDAPGEASIESAKNAGYRIARSSPRVEGEHNAGSKWIPG